MDVSIATFYMYIKMQLLLFQLFSVSFYSLLWELLTDIIFIFFKSFNHSELLLAEPSFLIHELQMVLEILSVCGDTNPEVPWHQQLYSS